MQLVKDSEDIENGLLAPDISIYCLCVSSCLSKCVAAPHCGTLPLGMSLQSQRLGFFFFHLENSFLGFFQLQKYVFNIYF